MDSMTQSQVNTAESELDDQIEADAEADADDEPDGDYGNGDDADDGENQDRYGNAGAIDRVVRRF